MSDTGNKFKVGDLVKSNVKSGCYTAKSEGEVVKVYLNAVDVRLTKAKNKKDVGRTIYFSLEELDIIVSKESGKKDDSNKLDLTLVNRELVEAVARGMTYGLKYGRNNYKLFTKEDIPRFEAALLRHMFAHLSGEEKDEQSGNFHLDHVASTLNIIFWLRGNK